MSDVNTSAVLVGDSWYMQTFYFPRHYIYIYTQTFYFPRHYIYVSGALRSYFTIRPSSKNWDTSRQADILNISCRDVTQLLHEGRIVRSAPETHIYIVAREIKSLQIHGS